MQQMAFDLQAVQPASNFGPIQGAYRPFRQQADILMETDGAWAYGPTAERCLMRLAGRTVQVESLRDGVSFPFRFHANRSMVGWGPDGYGRLVIPDEVLGRAYVGRFGIRNLYHIKGRASGYSFRIVPDRPLEFPDFNAQADALVRVVKGGGDLRALYRLRGAYIALEWRPRDPLLRKVQSQYLLVTSVSLRGGRVRFSGPDWHVTFDKVTGWAPAEHGISLLRSNQSLSPVEIVLTHPMRFLDLSG